MMAWLAAALLGFVGGVLVGVLLALDIALKTIQSTLGSDQLESRADEVTEPTDAVSCDGCGEIFYNEYNAEDHAMVEHGAPSRELAQHILTPVEDLPDDTVEAVE